MKTLSDVLMNFRYAFNPRKPQLVPRMASAVWNSSVLKRSRLRYVDMAIDFACNLKCKHCFASSLAQPGRRKMELTDYSRIATECMALGAVNFSFQGGEPLMSPQLGDIISVFKPERNLISVTTNGTLLTEERVNELKRMKVDILTVSLDSADPEEHDAFRGASGTFQKAVDGIHIALKKGLKVTLGTVVTHQNLKTPGINELVKMAKKLRVLLYFILPVSAGRWTENEDMRLSDSDLAYIESLTRQHPNIRTDLQANLGGYGCGAAKEILYLTPYGDVLVCPFLHVSPGNIFENSIEYIRNLSLENPYFASYHPKCLVSSDREFIDKYLCKTFEKKKLPLAWGNVFPESK